MRGPDIIHGNIGTLSIAFTAGIAAGAALCPSAGMHGIATWAVLAELSFLLASSALTLTCITRNLRTSAVWMCVLYFIIGIFCSTSDIFSSAGRTGTWLLKETAESAAARFRALIASVPFPHQESAALVNALLTGDRSGLGKDVVSAFRNSGASHILALSGLHLGIIYGLLRRITSFIGHSPAGNMARSMTVIGVSAFYTVATGAGASLVRALLFITITETARLMHRRAVPDRLYFTALLLQLTLTPQAIKSAGFQLSYLAMAGIFFLYPKMKSWFPEDGKPTLTALISRKIWNAISLAVSCQIFTGPAAWLYFGTFPEYFILTNLTALPVTTILMTSSVFTVVLHAAGICPDFLVTATDKLAGILMSLTDIISGM